MSRDTIAEHDFKQAMTYAAPALQAASRQSLIDALVYSNMIIQLLTGEKQSPNERLFAGIASAQVCLEVMAGPGTVWEKILAAVVRSPTEIN